MRIRLAAIHTHTLVRLGVAHTVAPDAEIEFLGETGTAAEGRRLVAAVDATVMTVDASLPDGDGVALAVELRESRPGLGVVVLARADDVLLFRVLEAGLSAFVPRSAPAAEVVAAIRHAAVAATSFSTSDLAGALARRRPQGGALLSPRELEVLGLMREGASVPRMAVALQVSESTVKTYVSRLYGKLGVNNRAQALMAGIQRGLLAEPRGEAGFAVSF
jgi:DNA-binding NarL/FixJ family response regulator